jgi:TolB-like protein/Tfp pilus assembly protein PilF
VSRAEIADRLWGPDVFVDVETGVNTAIRKIRQALGDDRNGQAYVVTVPAKGYRFGAAVSRAGADAISRIAVLPFENLTGDPAREYLADSFTEELIAVLGPIDPAHVAVCGRTSVMPFKRSARTVAEIVRDLAAAYLVEGAVRMDGSRVRVTARLIRAADQVQLWSGAFDGEPASVLELERELCLAIAEQVRVQLAPQQVAALERRHTRDAEAYHLYLEGRYYWNQLTPQTTRRAVECFTRATARDPDYALAWSGIADAHAASPISGDTPPLVVGPLARAAAERALAADPRLAAAHTSMGAVQFFLSWEWADSEQHHRRALELDPLYAHGHRMLGILLSHLGRHEEALAEIRRAREIDPLYVMHHSLSSQIAFSARRIPLAIQFARQAIAIDPMFWIARLHLAQAFTAAGDHQAALEAAEEAARLGGNSKAISLRGYVLASMGRTDEAREVLRTLEAVSHERFVPPYAMALVHLGLHDADAALAALERALDVRDVHLMFLPVDPKWDPLRQDPRFTALVARCGFAPRGAAGVSPV